MSAHRAGPRKEGGRKERREATHLERLARLLAAGRAAARLGVAVLAVLALAVAAPRSGRPAARLAARARRRWCLLLLLLLGSVLPAAVALRALAGLVVARLGVRRRVRLARVLDRLGLGRMGSAALLLLVLLVLGPLLLVLLLAGWGRRGSVAAAGRRVVCERLVLLLPRHAMRASVLVGEGVVGRWEVREGDGLAV